MHFTDPVYRNPYWPTWPLVQITQGCTHNSCKFCTMYKGVPFRMQPMEWLEKDLKELQAMVPHAKTIQLLSANPLALSFDRLMPRLELIKKYLPELEHMYTATRVSDIKNKTVEQLRQLRDIGVNEISLGVKTAYDFAEHNQSWVRATFNNIVIERTWRELNGEDCVPNEEMAKKKSICTSRSFNGMITDLDGLRTHVSNYAARCAEKLRQQGTVASIVGVFLNTNAFREDLPQYWNFQEMRLLTPSSSTVTIVKAANEVLLKLYRQGYHYKKAGVIVMGIGPNSPIQQDLFDTNAEQFEKMKRLDAVIDRINKVNGTETIVLGSQQYTQKDGKGKANVFANAIKHDFKSKNPTTRWSDIIVLK